MNLSQREREIADLIGDGRPYKEIAATLGISRRTVEGYVYAVNDKIPATVLPTATPYRRIQCWVNAHPGKATDAA